MEYRWGVESMPQPYHVPVNSTRSSALGGVDPPSALIPEPDPLYVAGEPPCVSSMCISALGVNSHTVRS